MRFSNLFDRKKLNSRHFRRLILFCQVIIWFTSSSSRFLQIVSHGSVSVNGANIKTAACCFVWREEAICFNRHEAPEPSTQIARLSCAITWETGMKPGFCKCHIDWGAIEKVAGRYEPYTKWLHILWTELQSLIKITKPIPTFRCLCRPEIVKSYPHQIVIQ